MLFMIASIMGLLIVVALPMAVKAFIFLLLGLYFAIVALMPKRPEMSATALRRVLLLTLCVLVFWPTYAVFTISSLPSIEPRKISLLLLLLTTIYTCLNFESTLTTLKKTLTKGGLLTVFLTIFVIWRFVSAMASYNLEKASIQFGWELLTFFLVFVATVISLRTPRDMQTVLVTLVICSGIVSVIAIVERLYGSNFISPLVPHNLELEAAQALALQTKIREGANRVQATFEHPMALAEFLVLMAPVVVYVAFRHRSGLVRSFGRFTLPMLLIAVLLTQTRSAFIAIAGIVFAGAILFMIKSLRTQTLGFKSYLSFIGIAIVIALLVLAAGGASTLVTGRSESEQQSSLERLEQIKRAESVIKKAPLLGAGVGLGDDTIGFSAYKGRMYVDNYYLTLALDSGMPGAVLFMLILAAAGFIGLRLYLSRFGSSAEMAGCFALAIFAFALIKSVLSIHYNLTYAYLLIGLLIVLKGQSEQREPSKPSEPRERRHGQEKTFGPRGGKRSKDLYRYS